jgi:hypothetical protein
MDVPRSEGFFNGEQEQDQAREPWWLRAEEPWWLAGFLNRRVDGGAHQLSTESRCAGGDRRSASNNTCRSGCSFFSRCDQIPQEYIVVTMVTMLSAVTASVYSSLYMLNPSNHSAQQVLVIFVVGLLY